MYEKPRPDMPEKNGGTVKGDVQIDMDAGGQFNFSGHSDRETIITPDESGSGVVHIESTVPDDEGSSGQETKADSDSATGVSEASSDDEGENVVINSGPSVVVNEPAKGAFGPGADNINVSTGEDVTAQSTDDNENVERDTTVPTNSEQYATFFTTKFDQRLRDENKPPLTEEQKREFEDRVAAKVNEINEQYQQGLPAEGDPDFELKQQELLRKAREDFDQFIAQVPLSDGSVVGYTEDNSQSVDVQSFPQGEATPVISESEQVLQLQNNLVEEHIESIKKSLLNNNAIPLSTDLEAKLRAAAKIVIQKNNDLLTKMTDIENLNPLEKIDVAGGYVQIGEELGNTLSPILREHGYNVGYEIKSDVSIDLPAETTISDLQKQPALLETLIARKLDGFRYQVPSRSNPVNQTDTKVKAWVTEQINSNPNLRVGEFSQKLDTIVSAFNILEGNDLVGKSGMNQIEQALVDLESFEWQGIKDGKEITISAEDQLENIKSAINGAWGNSGNPKYLEHYKNITTVFDLRYKVIAALLNEYVNLAEDEKRSKGMPINLNQNISKNALQKINGYLSEKTKVDTEINMQWRLNLN